MTVMRVSRAHGAPILPTHLIDDWHIFYPMSDPSPIRFDRLTSLVPELRRQLATTSPYPHAVLDDIFEEGALREASSAFPGLPPGLGKGWWPDLCGLPHPLQRICRALLDEGFVGWLRDATGLDQLQSDPEEAWGMARAVGPGTGLSPHPGSGKHPGRPLVRKYILAAYLTPDWSESDGGELELWDAAVSRVETKILPRFNRTVLVEASPGSFHGASPVAPSSRRLRQSVTGFYYLPDAHR
jgi:hypothetical protein